MDPLTTILSVGSEVASISEKVAACRRISSEEAAVLWNDAPLPLLGKLAFDIKCGTSGDSVFYNRNFHIEPSNICLHKCRFCSYRRDQGDPGSWDYTFEEIEEMAAKQAGRGITEVHVVGSVHPDYDLDHYVKIIETIKKALPDVSIKAFSAIEINHMAAGASMTVAECLRRLQQAGLEALPGGGAEIFDEEVRRAICPDKGSAAEWLATHRAAHDLGIPTNATMLYGHIETVRHRIDHMARLRDLQDATNGFNAFIPLKYRKQGNQMSAAGEVGITEDMRTLAMSRIFLDNFPHIKAYWPMLGKTATEMALAYGADDIDGTINDTTKIYSMAGAEEHPVMGIGEIEAMACNAGLKAVERDTFYNPLRF